MKNIITLAGLAVFLALPLSGAAQEPPPSPTPQHSFTNNHAEVGVFADYLRLSPSSATTNFVGAGGSAGFNVHPNLALEAEMSYDFARNFTTTTNNGVNTTFVTSSV